MKFDSLHDSKFFKATDIADENGDPMDMTVTIERITRVELDDDETKPVIFFKEFKKGAILNVTNKNRLKQMFGDDVEGAIGKKIVIYQTETEFQGKTTIGWRIRGKLPGHERAASVGTAAPRQMVNPDDPRTTRQAPRASQHPNAPGNRVQELDDSLPDEF